MLAIAWTAILLSLLNKANSSNFFEKNCEYNDELEIQFCRNITPPKEKNDYIITNSEGFIIENANITVFNRDFISIFPNASVLLFKNSNVNLTSEHVDTYHPLTVFGFINTKVNGNWNTSILQSFVNLRDFVLIVPSSKTWLEYPYENVIKGEEKLEILCQNFTNIDKNLDADFLEDGSLDALFNLREMFYMFGRHTHISKNLFKNNKNLRRLRMKYNSLETIEKGALPSSLKKLDLSYNKIRNIQGIFTNLVNLNTLVLSNNKIEEINPGDFGSLEKLDHLDISYNNIKVLRLDHVKNIPYLRRLYAQGNAGMEWEKDLETKVLLSYPEAGPEFKV